MEDHQWFYEQGGAQQGPVASSVVKELHSTGVIDDGTLVWHEGIEDWIEYSKSELCTRPALPAKSNSPVVAGGPPPTNVGVPYVPRKAQLNPNFQLSIRKVLGQAWNLMVSDFWPMVGFCTLATILYSVACNFVIPYFIGWYPIIGGFMFYTLRKLRGQGGDIENIFDGFRFQLPSLMVITAIYVVPLLILMGIGFVGGFLVPSFVLAESGEVSFLTFVFLGVGGILFLLCCVVISILTIVTGLATLVCMDCNVNWKTGMFFAWKAYKQHPWKMILLSIVMGFLYSAGVFVFIVGMFVSTTWMMIIYACVYEEAFGDRDKPTT